MALEQAPELDSSSLTVFEARFGDNGGALALLKSPPSMRDFFRSLLDKVDLPDTAPAGAVWDPFVRGWQQDDYYLITLTEVDQTAVRPGMVATRMFAIPVSQVRRWDALDIVFENLRATNRGFLPEQSISVGPNYIPPTVHPALLACAAHHLLYEERLAAIIGQDGFEHLVAALWKQIPPELRATFAFGFSFTPTDLPASRANIVAVPVSCSTRWSGYKFKCDSKWDQPLSDLTAALLNDAQADGFPGFLRNVGLVFQSFSDFKRYARLWDYWKKRSSGDLEMLHALLRSLGTLLPRQEQATEYKKEAIRIAVGALRDATSDDILALRSIKASSFPTDATELGASISEWLNARFHSTSSNESDGLAQVVLAVPSCQSAEWQAWVRNGLRHAFTPLEDRTAQLIWAIWTEKSIFEEISVQLPADAATEQTMLRTFAKTSSANLYAELVKWSTYRGWTGLMAKSALAQLGFAKAVQLVLEQSDGNQRSAAIQILCVGTEPSEVWASAFQYADVDLVKCAVAAAKAEPILWTTDVSDPRRWVELLDLATRTQPTFLLEVDADAVVQQLFNALKNGAVLTEGICGALERIKRLEFSGFVNRSQLWPKVPKRFLTVALNNTLRAWLKNYYLNPPTKPDLEKELASIIFAPEHIDFTFPQHSAMLGRGGFVLIEEWGAAPECESWLNALLASSTKIDQEVAQDAGNLILKRGWGIAAKTAKAIEEQRGRRDFHSVWSLYYDSLGMMEKIAFDYFLWKSPPAIGQQTFLHSPIMFNAVIFTALPEEFSAVKAHLTQCKEHTEKGTIYETGSFRADGIECKVAVVQTGMGNALSAAATERALNLFKPDFAFFVGIAGGLREDLKIGDVIAANKVYGYEGGKSGTSFQPRPNAPLVSHEAEQRASAVVRATQWQKRIISPKKSSPNAVVRPIAAGEKVLTSMTSEDMKRLTRTFTDAYAVAMEDLGFSLAVHNHTAVCFAVVRGISDLIENKKAADRSGSHEIAARNAAAFAFEMLAGLLRGRASVAK